MEGLLFLVFMFWIFKKISQTAKGKQARQKPASHSASSPVQAPRPTHTPSADELFSAFGRFEPEARSAQALERDKRTRQLHEQIERRRKQLGLSTEKPQAAANVPVTGEGDSAYAPMEPRTYESAPHFAYQGSLGGGSTEGEDICDPTLGHDKKANDDLESIYSQEIGAEPLLDFGAHAILQGVVMSEILARPNQRKWGGR